MGASWPNGWHSRLMTQGSGVRVPPGDRNQKDLWLKGAIALTIDHMGNGVREKKGGKIIK